jgi:alkylhydroperoxidase family enzyme
MDTNTAGSSANGASDEKIAALAGPREGDLFTRQEKAALALTEGMTVTPVDVPDEVFAEAQACFTDEQLVELVATIAMENYRSRFNRTFRVESLGIVERRKKERAGP